MKLTEVSFLDIIYLSLFYLTKLEFNSWLHSMQVAVTCTPFLKKMVKCRYHH